MNRIKSAGQTLYNHKKKAIFAAIVLAYGADYGRLALRDANIRTYYAKQALKFGEQTISAEHQPRRITVLVNKSANSGSAVTNFKKNALPLLNLSGIAVTVINTEDAKQMKALCSVLDSNEADGVFVVGGDGTANNAISGIMERRGLHAIPIGLFPGGKCNKALRLLIPSVFQHMDDVRYQCESAMAVIEETRARVKPLKCEILSTVIQEEEAEDGTKNKIEQIKEETLWTLGDISAGWFSYIEDKKWKRWYWGSLKRRFAYFWEMVKNSPHLLRNEVFLTDYCSGCNRCRTPEAPKVIEWRWWHTLIGTPKPAKPDPNVKDYSKIINEDCGRTTEICTQGTDIVIVGEQHEDSVALRFRVGGTFSNRMGIIKDGWSRCSEDAIIASPESGFYTTDLNASALFVKFIEAPERLQQLFIGGDRKEFGTSNATIKIRPSEKSIELFVPKNLRLNLESL